MSEAEDDDRNVTPLKYGETPWDHLNHADLLREVQRMYSAILSLQSVAKIIQSQEPHSLFWTKGSGHKALAKAEMILAPLHEKYEAGDIYRAFFRYAVDLLFTPELGGRWTACDGCQHFYGSIGDDESMVGKPCLDCSHQGRHSIRRPLEWKDLAPQPVT